MHACMQQATSLAKISAESAKRCAWCWRESLQRWSRQSTRPQDLFLQYYGMFCRLWCCNNFNVNNQYIIFVCSVIIPTQSQLDTPRCLQSREDYVPCQYINAGLIRAGAKYVLNKIFCNLFNCMFSFFFLQ